MNVLRLSPVILSLLMLSAHFFRSNLLPFLFLSLLLAVLLFVKKAWVARLIQISLLLGAIEWVRTILIFVKQREAIGLPWTRLAIILGVVALFTVLSALVFQNSALKKRYHIGNRGKNI